MMKTRTILLGFFLSLLVAGWLAVPPAASRTRRGRVFRIDCTPPEGPLLAKTPPHTPCASGSVTPYAPGRPPPAPRTPPTPRCRPESLLAPTASATIAGGP